MKKANGGSGSLKDSWVGHKDWEGGRGGGGGGWQGRCEKGNELRVGDGLG